MLIKHRRAWDMPESAITPESVFLNRRSLLAGGVALMTRMTSATQWGVMTNAQEGLEYVWRQKEEKRMEGDFETNSMRYATDERYDTGWTDPRVVWITPGQ